ncbi:MAG TPA: hypothetical protein PK110_05490 [Niabella sp.]|jgi:drug/metabolite transporter (DMT)-like permease|nr:hypothetical protein [Chitinophagaceae bacterium]HRN49457.1 hypothetical protein [Niabella sp.]HRO84259.1 hypothetical protein [Niabella sp.]HUN04615.1 hypothetical protein [Niabella sp.]
MVAFIFWLIIYCIVSAISITLVGDRELISGNLLSFGSMFSLVTNWKFIVAMLFAVFSRISFIMINNSLLKIPHLANASTSITMLATTLSIITVLVANYYFLNEKLSGMQLLGAGVVLIGIMLMVK